jgi:hypothetical protein
MHWNWSEWGAWRPRSGWSRAKVVANQSSKGKNQGYPVPKPGRTAHTSSSFHERTPGTGRLNPWFQARTRLLLSRGRCRSTPWSSSSPKRWAVIPVCYPGRRSDGACTPAGCKWTATRTATADPARDFIPVRASLSWRSAGLGGGGEERKRWGRR